jgi:(R,R)-butanediol dehydrogenase / meso-butanediol dehydrogenase / diacetyl reductase
MLVAEYAGDEQFRVAERNASPPGPGEVQIEVAFVGICGTDLHIRHGHMDGRVSIPSPIGHEMSGTVAALGEDVTDLEIGEQVTVMPLRWCGQCPACLSGNRHVCQNLVFVGIDSAGAMQQLWTVDRSIVVRIPNELPLDIAALSEPLAVAVHDVNRARILAGEKVLVAGGGPIGLLIGLVANSRGADVRISEPNEFRRALAQRLGLATLDPISSDVLAEVETWTDGAGVDAAFEVSGVTPGLRAATHALRVRGRLVVVAIHSQPVPTDLFRVFWRELELIGARVYEREDFEEAVRLLAAGEVPARELISAVEPLGRTPAAFDALESGAGVMKVLIDLRN